MYSGSSRSPTTCRSKKAGHNFKTRQGEARLLHLLPRDVPTPRGFFVSYELLCSSRHFRKESGLYPAKAVRFHNRPASRKRGRMKLVSALFAAATAEADKDVRTGIVQRPPSASVHGSAEAARIPVIALRRTSLAATRCHCQASARVPFGQPGGIPGRSTLPQRLRPRPRHVARIQFHG